MLSAFSFFTSSISFTEGQFFTGCCNSHKGGWETGGQVDACTYVLIGNPKPSLCLFRRCSSDTGAARCCCCGAARATEDLKQSVINTCG